MNVSPHEGFNYDIQLLAQGVHRDYWLPPFFPATTPCMEAGMILPLALSTLDTLWYDPAGPWWFSFTGLDRSLGKCQAQVRLSSSTTMD